ncbi:MULTISPECIES: ADP-ribosylglycohydrolase family protein [Streptomyces]|uniref:ADP-ribosylglycohydrolase family protein n=1 Tax=Streptomyces TaxID=1883 RepID=UPI000F747D1A|nr:MULTISPECIES: ADP-ribosylglycohydrolase family protein [Streptomyces]MCM3264623.1 ADP-ribosylglycohydrolase family protein [Streptomyces thermoviolaceus]RSR97122.1 ADP-ribosylglycohydrolase family protein [Streptomyces sp. WAC00469]
MGRTSGAVWGRTEQQDFRSRVRGTLLGVALGDALGAPVNGLDLDAIKGAYGPEGVVDLVPAHGRRGAVTHFTQLTLFSVDGLIRAQVRRDTGAWHPPTDLHRAYRRWAATQRDWGPDERRAEDGWLAREEWLYARRDATRALLVGFGDDIMGTPQTPKNPGERGPEAAVRSAPFGLLVGWDPHLVVQLAVECAAQTHGHPVACLTAGAYAAVVHALARGDSLDGAVQRTLALLAQRPGHEAVSGALQHALGAVRQGMPTPARVEELAGQGSAEGVLAVAVYCAYVGEDVRHGLCLAVNQSGPSGAAGALTGGLLGALHGETALPPAWLAELEGRPTVLALADDFAMEMTQGPALHGPAGSSPGWLARYPRA